MGSIKVKGTPICASVYHHVASCPKINLCTCILCPYGNGFHLFQSGYNYSYVFFGCYYEKKTYYSPTRYYDTLKLIIKLNDGSSHHYP